jgi:DNA-binding HxlR family transcriptional regulator
MTEDEACVAGLAYDVFDRNCPSRTTMDHMTGRWGLLVLAALRERTLRFGELRRRIDGVSEKMLSQALQALERDGLVIREQHAVLPPVVDYRLSDLGRGVADRSLALLGWVQENMGEIRAAQERYDAAGGRSGALAAGQR